MQAITLVYPLLVTLFAIPLLGEKVGVFRFGAVVVGFLGALIIVRPGGVPFDMGVLYAVGSGACYGLYIVLTRKVSATDTATTSMSLCRDRWPGDELGGRECSSGSRWM